MSWYKKSQSRGNVTFDEVVRAIDKIICEKGYFSYGDAIGSDAISKVAGAKSEGVTEIDEEEYVVPVPGYGMRHRPTYDGMPPAYDLTTGEAVPKDVYDHPEWSIASGHNLKADKAAQESWAVLQKIRGNPNADVIVYRAARKNELNPGDWVTFSRAYAKDSVEPNAPEKVYSFKVKAKDIIFAGDDINEFGYYPRAHRQSKRANIFSIADKTGILSPQKQEQGPRNLIDFKKERENSILFLVSQGIIKPIDISNRLGIDKDIVRQVLIENNVIDDLGRNEFYRQKYMKEVGDIVEEAKGSYEEFPTYEEVANQLGTTVFVIKRVCKDAGWDFKKLKTDRRRRVATFIGQIIDEMKDAGVKISAPRIGNEFKNRTGLRVAVSSVVRYIAEAGKKTPAQKKSPFMQLFYNYFLQAENMGFGSFFEKYKDDKGAYKRRLGYIIERFFNFYIDKEGCFLNDIDMKELNICEIEGRKEARKILKTKLAREFGSKGEILYYNRQRKK